MLLFMAIFPINVFAMNLDSYIDYTGVEVSQFADTSLYNANFPDIVGGALSNGFIIEKAVQYTVNQPLFVYRLNIDATALPSGIGYPQKNT